MQKKIVYVGFCYPHHRNTHAGYNRIKDYLKYDYVIDCNREMDFVGKTPKNPIVRIIRKVSRIILGVGVPINIIKCILLSLTHRNLVFHFIYPEISFKWLHNFKFSNKIVFTIHQPFDKLVNSSLDRYVKYADALILMSDININDIKKRYECENAIFIPHGIDMGFYQPDINVKKSEQICMVGSWLRDFDFASKVFTELKHKHPNLNVIAVTAKENFEKLPNFVDKKTGITDDELLSVYQQSQCVFLPMYSFTANNAVLESMSTGCQLVISSPNIDKSYFTDDDVFFTNHNIQDAIDCIESVVYKNVRKDTNNIRRRIKQQFEWSHVAEVTKSFLAKA